MIDLDLIMESAEWNCCRGFGWQESKVTYNEIHTLIARLRQAEKDAARYRFMRDMSDEVDVSRFFHIEVSERDAEIDEAMQCK